MNRHQAEDGAVQFAAPDGVAGGPVFGYHTCTSLKRYLRRCDGVTTVSMRVSVLAKIRILPATSVGVVFRISLAISPEVSHSFGRVRNMRMMWTCVRSVCGSSEKQNGWQSFPFLHASFS
ncbi:MAG TPA: hypothetical protein O0X50_00270 [Methanocorpusculum sp.]|nr:hypothetical protein [Methanocorpusculum sp.]